MTLPAELVSLRIDTPSAPRQIFAGVAKELTVFLRAGSEAEMLAALAAAGVVAAEGEALPRVGYWPDVGDIAIVGTIYTEAVEDEAGNVVVSAESKPGWHVNVLPAT